MNTKKLCPICNKEKGDVGPKIIDYENRTDPRFVNKQLTAIWKVMCGDCLADVKAGKIEIVDKS